jgi:hypothetical protein
MPAIDRIAGTGGLATFALQDAPYGPAGKDLAEFDIFRFDRCGNFDSRSRE